MHRLLLFIAFAGFACGQTYTVETIAGSASRGYVNGAGAAARFYGPYSVTMDSQGSLLAFDGGFVRKVTPGGIVSSIAWTAGAVTNDRPGVFVPIISARGITTDRTGNIFLGDQTSVWKISPAGAVSRFAAGFGAVYGLALMPFGNSERLCQFGTVRFEK